MASKIQQKTIKEYESQDYYVINLTRTNKQGIADLLCLKKGYPPLFIECKEKTDTFKPLQEYRSREVLKYGAEFLLIEDK